MTNREYYFLRKNEFDMLASMLKVNICPIYAVSGESLCSNTKVSESCERCIRAWLNEEHKNERHSI